MFMYASVVVFHCGGDLASSAYACIYQPKIVELSTLDTHVTENMS